jgi:glyoxylase-like metal-dependent hydrolase (beta-lactamase superfamily II)
MNKHMNLCLWVSIFLMLIPVSCSKTGKLYVASETEGPIKTNCYLLYELPSREAAVFDIGGPLDSLASVIKENDLSLKYIFITHAHWDHVEGIFDLKKKFPEAKVCISREEYTAMKEYTNFARESDPGRFAELMKDSSLAKMISIDLGAIKPDIILKDNETFTLGKSVITAILSPGHSAGSVCFSCGNFLFSGDVLSYRSVGNTDFYMASKPDLIQSVRTLYRLFPDSTIVYPGHGRPTDIGSEKINNKYISLDGGEWDIK